MLSPSNHLLDQFKILLGGTDPSRHFRVTVIPLHALHHSLFILLTIKEKLALPDHAVGATQFVEHIIEVDNLLNGIRGPRFADRP